ncbi:HAD family hydrolase [Streptomyces sp. NPDC015661]|uniref:HAD family hydrolase n=1 Tax=Streptomyces sp. NPDC015661 TaxID=3364961 RepID=UPI0036FB6DD8
MITAAVNGVMFDFSCTLLHIEPVEEWAAAVVGPRGGPAPGTKSFDDLVERLTRYGALPGGAEPERVPGHLERLWDERDLSPESHRAAYTGLTREAGLTDPGLVTALYERHMSPAAWQPYPDTGATLRALRSRGVPVAVVSNIGWDLRPVFRAHGFDELVDGYVLSYEVGALKPDPAIFRAGCELLGVAPPEVLMVGDNRTADGGARALGCPVHFVDPLPVDRRPSALAPVLERLAV